ncbi:hypothetical protein CYMTET_33003, partial [Cymbomonas tetramitiformis]
HSLGGAIVALLTLKLQHILPGVKCVAYAPPPCVCGRLSAISRDLVETIVHADDIVPRASVANISRVVQRLAALPEWQGAAAADMRHMLQRYVVELGTPRVRGQQAFPRLQGGDADTEVELHVDEAAEVVQLRLAPRRQKGPTGVIHPSSFQPSAPAQGVPLTGESADVAASPDDTNDDHDLGKGSVVVLVRLRVGCPPSWDPLEEEEEEEEDVDRVHVLLQAVPDAEQDEAPELYIPGKVLYMHKWRGVYRCAAVASDCPTLTRRGEHLYLITILLRRFTSVEQGLSTIRLEEARFASETPHSFETVLNNTPYSKECGVSLAKQASSRLMVLSPCSTL